MVHNIGIEEDHVENYFFDISTTQNHHPNYIKHVLGCILVFSPYLGSGSGLGGLARDFYTSCSRNFSPWAAQKSKFLNLSL